MNTTNFFLNINAMLLLMILFFTPFGSIAGEYSKEIVFYAPWGSSLGEVGRSDDSHYGPESFTVTTDKSIYLLDTYNKRILKYNSSGELISYILLNNQYHYGSSELRFIENEQLLYLHNRDANKFMLYNVNDELVRSYIYQNISNIGFSPDFYVHDDIIAGINNEVINISENGKRYIGKGAEGEDEYIVEIQHDTNAAIHVKQSITSKYSNSKYRRDRTENWNYETIHIERPDEREQILDISDIYPGHIISFGKETRDKSAIYFAYPMRNLNNPLRNPSNQNNHVIALKYDSNINLESIIDDPDFLPLTDFNSEQTNVITDEGEIYTLTLSSDGARIFKWEMK